MRAALGLALGLGLGLAAACDGGGPGVTLPRDYQTAKSRTVVVDPLRKVAAPYDQVRALSGMDGAPETVHPELPALGLAYGRADGAHVSLVRVGPTALCALGLDALFPDPTADPDDPANYDFARLDTDVASVAATGTAGTIWRADFAPAGCAPTRAIVNSPEVLAPVVANTLRHLVSGAAWDPAGRRFTVPRVEVFGEATALLASGVSAEALYDAYEAAARAVRAAFPTDASVTVAVGGVGFHITPGGDNEALGLFLDHVAARAVPLDFLTVRAAVGRAHEVREVASIARSALDARGLGATTVSVTQMAPTERSPFGDASLDDAYLGAFEAAARIFLQDTGADVALSGVGPWTFADGATHADAALEDVADLLVPSAYFTPDGTPRPSFMARFGLRQLDGDERLVVDLGNDRDGMAVLASRPKGSATLVRVLIANANVEAGAAAVTYDLRLPSFVAPAVRRVSYRLAVVDHRTEGLSHFFFSELGSLEPNAQTGDVTFSHEMPVPGVHLIEFERILAP